MKRKKNRKTIKEIKRDWYLKHDYRNTEPLVWMIPLTLYGVFVENKPISIYIACFMWFIWGVVGIYRDEQLRKDPDIQEQLRENTRIAARTEKWARGEIPEIPEFKSDLEDWEIAHIKGELSDYEYGERLRQREQDEINEIIERHAKEREGIWREDWKSKNQDNKDNN